MYWYEVSQSAVPPSEATWVTPTTTLSPYIDLKSAALGKVFGFSSYSQIGTGLSQNYRISDLIPQTHNVQSLVVRCNLLANLRGMSYPNDLAIAIPVGQYQYGANMSRTPRLQWLGLSPAASFDELILRISDQDLRPIFPLLDTSISVVLAFRKKK
jgi:hypothetical protein